MKRLLAPVSFLIALVAALPALRRRRPAPAPEPAAPEPAAPEPAAPEPAAPPAPPAASAVDTPITAPAEMGAVSTAQNAGAWLRRWWGVPAGLVMLLCAAVVAVGSVDAERSHHERVADRYVSELIHAEAEYANEHGGFTDNLAELLEYDAQRWRYAADRAADRFIERGLDADLTVSPSGRTVVVRVPGAAAGLLRLR
jgi:hypothetical protein